MNNYQIIHSHIAKEYLSGDDRGLISTTSLIELGILDSMGVFNLVRFVEDTFHIKVEDDEYIPDYFATIERIEMLIREKQEKVCV